MQCEQKQTMGKQRQTMGSSRWKSVVHRPSSIVCLGILIILLTAYDVYGQSPVTLTIPEIRAAAGATGITVPVQLASPGPVRSIQLVIRYDPDRLEVTDVSLTPRTEDAGFFLLKNWENIEGSREVRSAMLNFTGQPMAAGTGAVANLTVDVAAVPASLVFITESDSSFKTKVYETDTIRYPLILNNGLITGVPDITVPESVSFGEVSINEVGERELTIQNTGAGDLTVFGVEVTDTDGGRFSMAAFTPNTIVPPGGSTSATLFFAPVDTSDHAGTVTIESDAPGTNLAEVRLRGVGTLPEVPRAAVSPLSLNFGWVRVGTSETNTVTLGNDGDAPLAITAIMTQTSVFASALEEILVPPAQTRSISVTHTPSEVRLFIDTLTFSTNDPAQPIFAIPLAGRGGQAKIALSPDTLRFGRVTVGDSLDGIVRISNPGTWPLTVTSLDIMAGDGAFRAISPFPPQTVQPGAELNITIRFTPTGAPVHTGRLRIVSDAEAQMEITARLLGESVKDDVVPVDEHGEEIRGLFGEDNSVGMDDFALFVTAFGLRDGDDGFGPQYDLDDDGTVGLDDFLIFVANFGKVAVNH